MAHLNSRPSTAAAADDFQRVLVALHLIEQAQHLLSDAGRALFEVRGIHRERTAVWTHVNLTKRLWYQLDELRIDLADRRKGVPR